MKEKHRKRKEHRETKKQGGEKDIRYYLNLKQLLRKISE